MKSAKLVVLFFVFPSVSVSQGDLLPDDYSLLELRLGVSSVQADTNDQSSTDDEYPEPKSVMYKSLMVPGWGQIVNKQAWKVPIVYGMYAGVGYYTYTVHQNYKDYRAAYYNAQRGEDTDFKFGPTPERLQGISPNQLQSNRNTLRNRRDLMVLIMVLAHGLNAVDAYVFAHMRSFDVSDDLSAKTSIAPGILADRAPGVTLSFELIRR
ncbi:MAG: DUF5683 domain-containing protein [Balneolaceae bacterium]